MAKMDKETEYNILLFNIKNNNKGFVDIDKIHKINKNLNEFVYGIDFYDINLIDDDELYLLTLYLMQGELNKVKYILDSYNFDKRKKILNMKTCNNNGTLLHDLLFFNNCEETIELYKYMLDNGAICCKNNLNQYPYEQNRNWDLDDNIYLLRDIKEFEDLYKKIKNCFHPNNLPFFYISIVI